MRWDAVVVGSGAGGLTAAVALSRHGQKVLVLEQHYLPGGWCQSFSLDGYRFSPGVHYIGECGPGGSYRRVLEGLGLTRDLELCELNPDGFDHLMIGGERFDVPKGYERLLARLIARFPHEESGLRRYFDVMNTLNRQILECEDSFSFPKILTVPFRAPTLLKWGFRTQDALLQATITDPALRAILSAQSGDHGLAPSRVSLPLHASLIVHYYGGGFYPRGGARRIPAAMIKELRRNGGAIRLRAPVRRIVVDRGRATGVELDTGERIEAGVVISNADPAITFGRLLSGEHGKKARKKVARMNYSVSLLSVFCAVDMDLRTEGYDSGNYWWYRTREVGALYERMEHQMPGAAIDGLFLTITTLKDPGHGRRGHHVIEMFTFVPWHPFTTSSGGFGARGDEYERRKKDLGDAMLEAAENVIPGLRSRLTFLNVATPLTNDHYCASFRGAAYGTAKTPFQLGPFGFGIETEIPDLYSVGASTISHGVAGATMSGLIAAKNVLGLSSTLDLLGPADGSLRVYPADKPEEWLPAASRLEEVA